MEFAQNLNPSPSTAAQQQIDLSKLDQYHPLLAQLSALQEQKQQLFQKLAPFLSLNPIPGIQLPEINCFTNTQTHNYELDFQQNAIINDQKEGESIGNEEIVNDGPIKAFVFENNENNTNNENNEKLSKSTKKINKKKTKKSLQNKKKNKRNRTQNSNNQKLKDKKTNSDQINNDTDNSLENFERIHWINQHANIIETMLSESQDKLQLLARFTQQSQQ